MRARACVQQNAPAALCRAHLCHLWVVGEPLSSSVVRLEGACENLEVAPRKR